jgi:hypothetical protein
MHPSALRECAGRAHRAARGLLLLHAQQERALVRLRVTWGLSIGPLVPTPTAGSDSDDMASEAFVGSFAGRMLNRRARGSNAQQACT